MNVAYLLDNSAFKNPERPSIVLDSCTITYWKLACRTNQLARAMLALGLTRPSNVAILSPNGFFFVESYFAAVRAGFVAGLINTRLSNQEIIYILNDSRAEALFYDAVYHKTILEIGEHLDTVKFFVSSSSEGRDFAIDYEKLIAGNSDKSFLAQVHDSDPCQLVYTSGTTGRPKGAILTHGNVIWNFFNTIFLREDPPGARILIIGPLFHVAPLNNQLTIHIGLGGTIVFIPKFEPELVFRVIERERISVMVAAPSVYNFIVNHPKISKYDLTSIRHLTSGADKLVTETRNRILECFKGVRGVYNAYGCTEATATITVLKASESAEKDESVGRAAPFLQARILGPEGKALEAGETGEICCCGPNVMQGYFNKPEATSEAIRDGWLHTGDLARMDDEGYFYIVDRKKDMLVSGGENIYPREVEEVLYTHPEILDAAVVGVPDETWGECVKAFVVRKPGSSLDPQGVIDYCRSRLASYKKPKFVQFINNIPRSPSGKALKNRLRSMT